MLFATKRLLRHGLKHSFILIAFSLISLMLFLHWLSGSSGMQKCFATYSANIHDGGHVQLEDVLLSEKKPTPGKSIFFHETSCSPSTNVELTAREACAIESAALANPNSEIFVLFAAPRFLSNSTTIEAVLSYPNVNLRNVNLWTYTTGSPIYDWLKDGRLFESKYVLSHMSDFLRYLTLWKWGGTYLDLDVIVKGSLEKIPANYAGAESDRFVAAGVLNFDSNGFGHQIADLCLRQFQMNYDGSDWGNNGPGVITRVLQEVCKTKSPILMNRERCLGFKVFPKEAFYAVRWWNWNHFFERKHLNEALSITNDSIVVHIWNRHSSSKVVQVGSPVAYVNLAKKYCPKVYKSVFSF